MNFPRGATTPVGICILSCLHRERRASEHSLLMSVPGDPWCKLNSPEKVAGYFLVAPLAPYTPVDAIVYKRGPRISPDPSYSRAAFNPLGVPDRGAIQIALFGSNNYE